MSNMRRFTGVCSTRQRNSRISSRISRSSSKNHWIVITVLLHLITAILILLLKERIIAVRAIPMMINIEPYDDECFFLKHPSSSPNKPKAKILSGSYEMIDETNDEKLSAEPLMAYILETSSRNNERSQEKNDKIVWRSIPKEPRGTFRVPIISTKRGYWLCFQNSNHGPDNTNPERDHPDHILRTVGFDYQVSSIIPNVKPVPLLFTSDHSDEWRDKSASVQSELRYLMTHRDYIHMRESDHRRLVENTFDDIMSWTMIETTLVILIAICQVLYFRRFLEKQPRY